MNARKLRQKQKKYDFLNDVNFCCYDKVQGHSDPTAAKAIREICWEQKKQAVS